MRISFTALVNWKKDLARYKKNVKKGKPLLDQRDLISAINITSNFVLPFLAGFLGAVYSKWFFIIGLPAILFDLQIEERKK